VGGGSLDVTVVRALEPVPVALEMLPVRLFISNF